MKLKFERFEGLASFSVRGEISVPEMKMLHKGLETIAKAITEPLMVNLTIAEISEPLHPVLVQIKKQLPSLTKQKIHWITPIKTVGDFATVGLFASRLAGSKSRQIGERIKIEDDIFQFQEEIKVLEAKVAEMGGNEETSRQIILENRILKEQERILKDSIAWQTARMKLQVPIDSENKELEAEILEYQVELRKAYAGELDL